MHLSFLHRCVIYSPDLQWWYYLSFVIEIIARLNAQNSYLTIEICFLKDFYHDPVIYLINSLVFTLNMNGNTIQLHRTIKILLKLPVCFIILLFCTVLLKIAFVKHCAIIQCHLPFVDRELKTQTRDHYIGEVHVCAAEITISSRSAFWPFKRYTYRVPLDDNVKNELKKKKPSGTIDPFLLSRMKSNHPHTIKTIWCCYVEELFLNFIFFWKIKINFKKCLYLVTPYRR